jgi:hypothetical protein
MKQMESRILAIRGQRVMLAADLAAIYGVTTKTLNQAVARNRRRFPRDFAFRLHHSEAANASGRGRTARVQPWVFTDHGALMAANVLHSKRAIQVSVHVVRASVRLRAMVAANKELAMLLDELERRISHDNEAIAGIIKAIRELAIRPEAAPKRRISLVSEG